MCGSVDVGVEQTKSLTSPWVSNKPPRQVTNMASKSTLSSNNTTGKTWAEPVQNLLEKKFVLSYINQLEFFLLDTFFITFMFLKMPFFSCRLFQNRTM